MVVQFSWIVGVLITESPAAPKTVHAGAFFSELIFKELIGNAGAVVEGLDWSLTYESPVEANSVHRRERFFR